MNVVMIWRYTNKLKWIELFETVVGTSVWNNLPQVHFLGTSSLCLSWLVGVLLLFRITLFSITFTLLHVCSCWPWCRVKECKTLSKWQQYENMICNTVKETEIENNIKQHFSIITQYILSYRTTLVSLFFIIKEHVTWCVFLGFKVVAMINSLFVLVFSWDFLTIGTQRISL